MTSKDITLNVWENNTVFATAIQGEVDSRFLSVKLVDDNGPIDLTGKHVKFLAKKPDSTIVFINMTVEDAQNGIAILSLTEQMSAVAGILDGCEIYIISEDGETLIARKINIFIHSSLWETVKESNSELTAIPSKLTDLTGILPIAQGGTGAKSASEALTALSAQPLTDNSLSTTNKTIVGAINELCSNMGNVETALNTIIGGDTQ